MPGTPFLDYKLSTWDGQGAEAATTTRTHSPVSDRSSALGQPPSATQTLRTGRSRSSRGGCSRPVAAPANMVAFVEVLEGRNGRVRAEGDPFSFFFQRSSASIGGGDTAWSEGATLAPSPASSSQGGSIARTGVPGTLTQWVICSFRLFPSRSRLNPTTHCHREPKLGATAHHTGLGCDRNQS